MKVNKMLTAGIILLMMLATACGNNATVDSESKGNNSSETAVTTTEPVLTTTPTVSESVYNIIDEDPTCADFDDSINFDTTDELSEYLDNNFSEYEYEIPVFDSEQYYVTNIVLWEMSKCYYITYFDKSSGSAVVSVTMSDEKRDYEKIKDWFITSPNKVEVTTYDDIEVLVDKTPFTQEDDYTAYGTTDSGLMYSMNYYYLNGETATPDKLIEKLGDFSIGK